MVLLLSAKAARAQGRVSIQMAPTLSFSRIYTGPKNIRFSSKGVALRFKLGASYDYHFQKNYYLSTGLLYSTHRLGVKSAEIEEAHELQYLQVPLLFKPYTSEISLDTRMYITLGLCGQIKLKSRNTQLLYRETPFITKLRRLGFAGLMGAGVEYDTSFSTSVFAGISYQRGLLSLVKQHEGAGKPEIMSYADIISIDLGVKL